MHIAGPTPRVSDSEGLGRRLSIDSSKKISGAAEAAGPGPHFENC